jgi:predicted GIY-YIG superfamily endonuclease
MRESEQRFWVYILENPSGRFYVGHTNNLERRLAEHNDENATKSKFTVKNGPWSLKWSESFPDRSLAVSRERQIKRKKSADWIREVLLNQRSLDKSKKA